MCARRRRSICTWLSCTAALVAWPQPRAAAADEVVALVEVHTISGSATSDTIVTQVAPGRVRIAHRAGIAILDIAADRFLLLDPETSTYRSTSLSDWEARIQAALEDAAAARRETPAGDGRGAAPVPHYERSGDGGEIAGHACELYHFYARQEVFPGELEEMEQELWITRELAMPPGAYEAYRRVLAILERIGLDAAVALPPGVVLRRLKWSRPAGEQGASRDEVETNEVVRIERWPLAGDEFAIPPGYVPADSAAMQH